MAEALKWFPVLDFIDNEDFRDPKKQREFMQSMEGFEELLCIARTREVTFESMCSAPILTRAQEQHLFRQMNCMKYVANQIREQGRNRDRERLARLHAQIKEVADVLYVCNIKLAVAHLKKYHTTPDKFQERFSDACESISRAVRKFDYKYGNKFSTYCMWAIIKNFSRSIPAENPQGIIYTDEYPFEPNYEQDMEIRLLQEERQALIDELMNCLTEREKFVVRSYELNDDATYDAIGAQLGITKERVRQIKNKALGRLKVAAELHFPRLVGAM